eukprot:688557_1
MAAPFDFASLAKSMGGAGVGGDWSIAQRHQPVPLYGGGSVDSWFDHFRCTGCREIGVLDFIAEGRDDDPSRESGRYCLWSSKCKRCELKSVLGAEPDYLSESKSFRGPSMDWALFDGYSNSPNSIKGELFDEKAKKCCLEKPVQSTSGRCCQDTRMCEI